MTMSINSQIWASTLPQNGDTRKLFTIVKCRCMNINVCHPMGFLHETSDFDWLAVECKNLDLWSHCSLHSGLRISRLVEEPGPDGSDPDQTYNHLNYVW